MVRPLGVHLARIRPLLQEQPQDGVVLHLEGQDQRGPALAIPLVDAPGVGLDEDLAQRDLHQLRPLDLPQSPAAPPPAASAP